MGKDSVIKSTVAIINLLWIISVPVAFDLSKKQQQIITLCTSACVGIISVISDTFLKTAVKYDG